MIAEVIACLCTSSVGFPDFILRGEPIFSRARVRTSMPPVKQPATNTAQEALSLTSIGNKGPMFLYPSDP